MSLKSLESSLGEFFTDVGIGLKEDTNAGANVLFSSTSAEAAKNAYGFTGNQADPLKAIADWRREAALVQQMVSRMDVEFVPQPKQQADPTFSGTPSTGTLAKASSQDASASFVVNTAVGPIRMMKLGGVGLGGADITISLAFGPSVRNAIAAARAAGFHMVINNAFRAKAPKQANAAPATRSNHTRGDAIDVDMIQSSPGTVDWLRANGGRFGVIGCLQWRHGMAKDPLLEYNHFSVNGY